MVKLSDVLDKKGRGLKEANLEPGRDAPPAGPGSAPAPPPAAQPHSSRPAAAEEIGPAPLADETPLSQEEASRLISRYHPDSPQAKRIDMLRSQLLYPFHGEPPRTILITSAAPKEGRSLLTANLAISFARGLQQYVMVMDCHLTEPSQHRLLKVPRTPGLTDFLLWDAAVADIIHWTDVDRLSVIPAGSPSNRSAEILATDKMAGLIKELRSRYKDRYIILDSPPVQAFDDPAVLARMVEAIVVVVLGGVTDRELVLRSIRQLPEEKILGLVLNDMKAAVMDAPALGSLLGEGD
ncbi:MAG: polysaccharide biosynthesis tyrosine autokinase [Proteobacteria bacterium]|nr:polysaccharide biosynthesis tyrosine autokinase [Pseudomonadota bacterium]